jgi:acetyl-CoA carboxylase biotin carboxyl carrier protein
MSPERIEQLAAWLREADIGLLELHGPGTRLSLRHDRGGEVSIRQDSAAGAPQESAAPARTSTVAAPGVGVFRQGHPLRAAALAPVGTRVRAGQPLGLLQIGALLLPVTAPQAGTVVHWHASESTPVGYGTPLVDLELD